MRIATAGAPNCKRMPNLSVAAQRARTRPPSDYLLTQGGRTSRTYEANLFGVVYLLSSALIFNTMFPIDASSVAAINTHCNHALQANPNEP